MPSLSVGGEIGGLVPLSQGRGELAPQRLHRLALRQHHRKRDREGVHLAEARHVCARLVAEPRPGERVLEHLGGHVPVGASRVRPLGGRAAAWRARA